MTGSGGKARGLVALGVGLYALTTGCASPAGKKGFIQDILSERAPHLEKSDRREISTALTRAEAAHDVDALLLLAVMEEESHYRIRARSSRGAIGLMQIQPDTGRHVAEKNGIAWRGKEGLYDPDRNVQLGAAYLAELRETFGSWHLALTAYNQGPQAARKARRRGKVPSSAYAKRVLRRHEGFRRRFQEAHQVPAPAGVAPGAGGRNIRKDRRAAQAPLCTMPTAT